MATNGTFPEADAQAELNPAQNKNFAVDSVSSAIDYNKVQAELEKKKKAQEKKDAMQTLKSAIVVSAVIVAVAGAAFAITKKLKEK